MAVSWLKPTANTTPDTSETSAVLYSAFSEEYNICRPRRYNPCDQEKTNGDRPASRTDSFSRLGRRWVSPPRKKTCWIATNLTARQENPDSHRVFLPCARISTGHVDFLDSRQQYIAAGTELPADYRSRGNSGTERSENKYPPAGTSVVV